ncbi:MAG: glycosyltransferase family 39 protein [Planctomycetes bacterium]|nr:glycosyltransferase family 39 protein [Planctomycetota bacterium]
MLPHVEPLDGTVIERQVAIYRYPQPGDEHDESYHYYPHLTSRLVAQLPDPRATLPYDDSLESQLAFAGAPWLEFRRVSVVLTTLLILATWLLARRFAGERWALFAAALLATSLLFGFYSAEMRPHGIAATANAFAVLACLRLLSQGSLASYLLAGSACGLAVGALQYGVFTLPCLLVAHLLARRGEKRAWWKLALALLPVALCVRVFYPFYFVAGESYFDVQGANLNLSGQPLKLDKFNGAGFRTIFETLCSYDPLLLVLGLGGALLLFVRALRRRSLGERGASVLVCLAFALPYGFVTGMYAETWERFVVNLLPWFSICAAVVFALWHTRARRPWLPVATACALLVPMLLLDCKLAQVRSAPDTLQLAARWVECYAEPVVTRIQVLPYVDLPLFHSQAAVAESGDKPWISRWLYNETQLAPPGRAPRYDLHLPPAASDPDRLLVVQDPLAWVESRRPELLVMTVDPSTAYLTELREGLLRRGERLARFTSRTCDEGEASFFAGRHMFQWDDPFFLHLARSARMGSTIEIWRPQVR